jgi:lipid II:glycine glycyltransferase (peptidoglycan interpeptide bridge formation enzyme)
MNGQSSFGAAGVYAHGQTVAIDLSLSEGEIWKNYERKLRQKLRKCMMFGLLSSIDDEWTYLEDFIRLYRETMWRNNAAPFYFFPEDYFRRLKAALGPHGTMLVTKHGERVVAACILIEYHGLGHLYLSASDDEFTHYSPSKLMTHDSAMWARQRGVKYFHMGGGRGNSNDSLFSFKASFSPQRFSFHTGRWILQPERYQDLTERRRLEANGRGTGGDYFPAYRKPYGNTLCATRTDKAADPVWQAAPAQGNTAAFSRFLPPDEQ